MDHFKASSTLLFRQQELFNILVSERKLRHRELRNKVKIVRKFDTGHPVVEMKQMKSSRKIQDSPEVIIQNKGTIQIHKVRCTDLIPASVFAFCEGVGMPGRKVKESASRM